MMINNNFFPEILQSGHGNLFSRKRFPSFHFLFEERHDDEHYLQNTQYNTLKEENKQNYGHKQLVRDILHKSFLRMITTKVLISKRVKNPTFPAMLKIHLRKLILTGMLESERLHFQSARETETETHFQRILYAQQIRHL